MLSSIGFVLGISTKGLPFISEIKVDGVDKNTLVKLEAKLGLDWISNVSVKLRITVIEIEFIRY